MAGEANKQRVLDYFEALVRDDFDRVAELFSDDVRWYLPRTAERYGMSVPSVGIEEFLRLQRQGLDEIYHPQRWTTQKLVAEGSSVSALMTLEAVTPSGAAYKNDYLFLFEFTGDEISAFWEFVDTAYVAEFLSAAAGGA